MGEAAAAYAKGTSRRRRKRLRLLQLLRRQAGLLLRRRTHHPLGDSVQYGRGPPPILIAPAETPPQTFLSLQGTPIFLSMGGGGVSADGPIILLAIPRRY